MSFKIAREGKMFRVILLCDVCEREMARSANPERIAPSPYIKPPPGTFALGGGISFYEIDGPRELANVSGHACSKACARALLSKLHSAVEDAPVREKP